jgi:AraC family transcriptional regulator, transcriptional activator of pobA
MNHFKSLSELHLAHSYPPPENPLIGLVRCTGTCGLNPGVTHTSDFFMIGFKKLKAGAMQYGKTHYDHDRGSMSFIRPHQIVGMRNVELEEDGFIIYVHEDFLIGHALHDDIKKYGFFDYEVNEALHLSPKEEQIIWELYRKIETEYHNNTDEYSRDIMLTHIDSILKYAQRFYKRQFINRATLSGKTVSRFNGLLTAYFEKGLMKQQGLPTVNYLAAELNLSSRYMSDLLKQETGKTAIDLIHLYLISEAKNLLVGADQSVSEIAYGLGFENPPYFSRLFKKEVGMTPNEFRKLSLN